MRPLKRRRMERTKQVYEGHQQMFDILNSNVTVRTKRGYERHLNALNSNISGKILSKKTAKTIFECIKSEVSPLFPQIAVILNSILSNRDDNDLPVDQRTALRSCLCVSSTFIHVLLFQLSPYLSQIISHLPDPVRRRIVW